MTQSGAIRRRKVASALLLEYEFGRIPSILLRWLRPISIECETQLCASGVAQPRNCCSIVADGKLQVLLFTCHSDWAADWKQRAGDAFTHIEMLDIVEYYRPPAAVLAD